MFVYKITCIISNRIYVGKTIHSIESRFNRHIKQSKNPSTKFHHEIAKFGKENFEIVLLQECNSVKELNQAERDWIEKLNSTDPIVGLNSTCGGQCGLMTCETKIKISNALKNRKLSNEHRSKISAIMKTKHGALNNFYGRHHDDNTKKSISNSMKGERGPCYGRTGSKHPMFGKTHSDESKKKMSDIKSGKKLTDKHYKAVKAWHAKRKEIISTRDDQIFDLIFNKGFSKKNAAEALGVGINLIYGAMHRFKVSKSSEREVDCNDKMEIDSDRSN
jgi:group I intron endonuclease